MTRRQRGAHAALWVILAVAMGAVFAGAMVERERLLAVMVAR